MTKKRAPLRPVGFAFTADRADLLTALEAAAAPVRSGSIPVLECLRLETAGGHVTITGTDLDLEVVADASAIVEQEGSAVVLSSLLLSAIRSAGSTPRLVVVEGNRLEIRSDAADAGLACFHDPEAFPTTQLEDDGVAVRCPADSLAAGLARVKSAIANEETRYYLNGVYAELPAGPDQPLLLTATDGHRLHHVTVAGVEIVKGQGPATGILPRLAVKAIADLAETTILHMAGKQARATSGAISITTRLIDGTYPDYRHVMPRPDAPLRASLDRKGLMEAIDRVRWVDDSKARIVRLNLAGQVLTLSAQRSDVATAEAELAVADAGPAFGPIGFNSTYLARALAAHSAERLTLVGSDPVAPWLLMDEAKPDDRIVVMPLRV